MDRMRAFYLAYSIFPQAVGKLEDLSVFNIPWGYNIVVIREGWSHNALVDSIKDIYKPFDPDCYPKLALNVSNLAQMRSVDLKARVPPLPKINT
jgi:hypothetical protein